MGFTSSKRGKCFSASTICWRAGQLLPDLQVFFSLYFFNVNHFESLYWIRYHVASFLCFVLLAARHVGSQFPDQRFNSHLMCWEVVSNSGPLGKSPGFQKRPDCRILVWSYAICETQCIFWIDSVPGFWTPKNKTYSLSQKQWYSFEICPSCHQGVGKRHHRISQVVEEKTNVTGHCLLNLAHLMHQVCTVFS